MNLPRKCSSHQRTNVFLEKLMADLETLHEGQLACWSELKAARASILALAMDAKSLKEFILAELPNLERNPVEGGNRLCAVESRPTRTT